MLGIEPPDTHENRLLSWIDPRHSQKKRFVWGGVSVFIVAIVGIWVVNTKTVFQQAQDKGFPEKILLERAKADSEQLMNSIQASQDLQTIVDERQKQQAIRTSLQSAFAHVIDSANAASVTSRVVPATSTTSK
jgi:hypothetical protein